MISFNRSFLVLGKLELYFVTRQTLERVAETLEPLIRQNKTENNESRRSIPSKNPVPTDVFLKDYCSSSDGLTKYQLSSYLMCPIRPNNPTVRAVKNFYLDDKNGGSLIFEYTNIKREVQQQTFPMDSFNKLIRPRKGFLMELWLDPECEFNKTEKVALQKMKLCFETRFDLECVAEALDTLMRRDRRPKTRPSVPVCVHVENLKTRRTLELGAESLESLIWQNRVEKNEPSFPDSSKDPVQKDVVINDSSTTSKKLMDFNLSSYWFCFKNGENTPCRDAKKLFIDGSDGGRMIFDPKIFSEDVEEKALFVKDFAHFLKPQNGRVMELFFDPHCDRVKNEKTALKSLKLSFETRENLEIVAEALKVSMTPKENEEETSSATLPKRVRAKICVFHRFEQFNKE
ncbi:unnamed protein product [Caenorhabditis auriculariae]|uniref:Uncharacterized protein n=1 Tax=Caenorhabditis auriculariae TaxID=2777116 RepID=A0A8S1GT09_9PELO|nr:unnamed protein product [Caenorhabditis auriculariae]